MTEMPIAERAIDCVADGPQGSVAFRTNIFLGNRCPETWPAGSRLELGLGAEQSIVTANAAVHPLLMLVPVPAGEGDFGIGMARDVELIGRKLLFPLLLCLHNFRDSNLGEAFAIVGK